MANEVTTTNSGSVGFAAGSNPFLEASDDMGAGSGGFLYLRFDGNTGEYTYGKDKDELEHGTRHALNANEIKRGWICWKDGEVMEETMTRIVDGKPQAKGTLTDHGPYDDDQDGWKEQASFTMRSVDTGDEFSFKTFSAGGRISVGNLISEYGKAFMKHPGKLAIVEIGASEFEVADKKNPKKKYKKFAPTFKIVDWADEDELQARLGDVASGAVDEAVEEDLPLNNAGRRGRNFN